MRKSKHMSIDELASMSQWSMAQAISGIVMAYNAAHCSNDCTEAGVVMRLFFPDWEDKVAEQLVENIHHDHMALEDMLVLFEKALEICKRKAKKS